MTDVTKENDGNPLENSKTKGLLSLITKVIFRLISRGGEKRCRKVDN